MLNTPDLPLPSPEAQNHSNTLSKAIQQAIEASNGKITFEAFMSLALYKPGLGYYSAGCRKIGADGDFVTAPEISPLFSYCVAKQCQSVLEQLGEGGILEFGAGSGKMAVDILLYLEKHHSLPEYYYILETSAELKERQQKTFEQLGSHLLPRIRWLSELPAQFTGMILANEVLDAMPVHRFCIQNNKLYEYYVGWQNGEFVWLLDEPSNQNLIDEVLKINLFDQRPALYARDPGISELSWIPRTSRRTSYNELSSDEAYTSEINLRSAAWIHSVSEILTKGSLLLIDYGFPREIYYHPQRSMGTLMCHYRHRTHPNPLVLVGLQDITAHVDFTFIATSAQNAGFTVSEYTTQAKFLLDRGLLNLINEETNLSSRLTTSQQIQTLTMPHEMGELFKVLLLSKILSK